MTANKALNFKYDLSIFNNVQGPLGLSGSPGYPGTPGMKVSDDH